MKIDFPHGYVEAITDQEQALRAGAQQQYDDIVDDWGNLHGPRVVGQYCPWPCIDPFLVIDHNIRAGQIWFLNGYRYQGSVRG